MEKKKQTKQVKKLKSSCKEIMVAGKFIFGLSLAGIIVGLIGLNYSYKLNWLELVYFEKLKGFNPINVSWLVLLISLVLLVIGKNVANKDKQMEAEDFLDVCQSAMDEVAKLYH